MSCTTCIKVNPVPACFDSGSYILTGITFPNNLDDTITVSLKDLATSRVDYFQVDIDGSGIPDLDISDYMPFDNHPYQLRFFSLDGAPTDFVITNPDLTTEEGCCLEFFTHQGFVGETEWILTTQGCAVDSSSSGGGSAEVIYSIYRAILSQNVINDPVTVEVLENTLGGTVVWTQPTPDLAHYNATLAGAFPAGKVDHDVSIDVQNANAYWAEIGRSSDDVMHLELWDEISGTQPATSPTASIGPRGVVVEILVYP